MSTGSQLKETGICLSVYKVSGKKVNKGCHLESSIKNYKIKIALNPQVKLPTSCSLLEIHLVLRISGPSRVVASCNMLREHQEGTGITPHEPRLMLSHNIPVQRKGGVMGDTGRHRLGEVGF